MQEPGGGDAGAGRRAHPPDPRLGTQHPPLNTHHSTPNTQHPRPSTPPHHRCTTPTPTVTRLGALASEVHPAVPRTPHPAPMLRCPQSAAEKVERSSGGSPDPRVTISLPPSARSSTNS